jgi:serine phosphatase RsbU (regulator of sigma subunit)
MAVLDDDSGRVRAVHHSGIDPAIADRWSEFSLSDPTPLCDAMVSGLPVLIRSIEHMSGRFPGMVTDTLAAGLSATASMPLTTPDGEILGAAGFGWASAQEFDVEQLRCLDLIAQMAAQALQRAVAHQRDQQESSRERADALLLQDAFLPRVMPETETLDVAAVYRPASGATLGGDWYDVFPVDGGTCLVIGDVAGHGLHSAGVMGQLRNAVRAYAVEDPSPASVMTRLNKMMCRLEPGELASAVVAVWDERAGTILRANAGHPPVLRCRVGEFGYLAPSPKGCMLGVSPDSEYDEQIKVLRPGTTLLFYTDGLIEWRGACIDDGMDALLAFVGDLHDQSPRAVCHQVQEWRSRVSRQEDDVCVLAARLRQRT